MEDFYIETPLDDVMAAEPAGSPMAISAWLAAQLADRIVIAFRTQDRNSAEATIYEIAATLTARALVADPSLVDTDELDGSERQRVYTMLETPDRRVLIRLLQERPMPTSGVRSLQAIFEHLMSLGLLSPQTALTPRGRQIAEGVLRHWPKNKAI